MKVENKYRDNCNGFGNFATLYHLICRYFGKFLLQGVNRAVACDVTSAALNQNVWQKRVAFVQEKVRFNYSVAVERRTAETTTV